MEGAGAALEGPPPSGGFVMGTRELPGRGAPPSQGGRDNGGRFVLPLERRAHGVAMRCPSRDQEGSSGAKGGLQTSGKSMDR